MSTAAQLLRPEPKRDRWGRYEIVPAQGGGKPKAHTRATTWAKTLEDTYNLEQWGNRMIALGMAIRPDLVMGAASCTKEDKQDLNQICKQAKDAAGAGSRAIIGTSLHRVTQRIDMGEVFEVPPMFTGDVTAYTELLQKWDVRIIPEFVERIVVLPDLGVAGTFDRIVEHEGQLKIADVKTGDNLDFAWLAIAIQLALYANAETMYDPFNETHELMPDVSKTEGLVFHMPAGSGTAELYRVDLTAGWEAALLCGQVRALRNHKGLAEQVADPIVLELLVSGSESVTSAPSDTALPVDVLVDHPAEAQAAPADTLAETVSDKLKLDEPAASDKPELPDTEPRTEAVRKWVVDRLTAIIAAEHAGDVARAWPEGLATLRDRKDHTEAELDQIAAVLTAVENKHAMTFPEPDPRASWLDVAPKGASFNQTMKAFDAFQEAHAPETAAEQLVRDAFPGTTDPLDELAPADDCSAVVFSLQQLSESMLTTVKDLCKEHSVPNLQSGRATLRHLNLVLEAIETAEKGPF